jgi:hypothetical protein
MGGSDKAIPATVEARPNLDETIFSDWPWHKRWRRRLICPFYRLSDTGLFGLTPLRTHILICGYQRAGTTLLLAMMEYALPEARRFGQETGGWRAATYAWRNHAVMISKVPNDIFKLHRLRKFYRGRKAKLKIILVIRDPRDVLTSKHSVERPGDYFQDIAEWRSYHAHYRLYRDEADVLVVRYEELVADVAGMAARMEAFTGEKFQRPLEEFHKERRTDFDTVPLNGVRPVEQGGVGRWDRPVHQARLRQILREVPDFPEILIELGYEKDATWVQRLAAPARPDDLIQQRIV